jgi:hypothetical protein
MHHYSLSVETRRDSPAWVDGSQAARWAPRAAGRGR